MFMAPPYLSVFYLVVPPFAVPVVVRNGIRSVYTPVPLLALLALLAGGFGLVESSRVQGVLQTLLAAALGGTVLHLQGMVDAHVAMLSTTVLLLICGMCAKFHENCILTRLYASAATLLSFLPRLSQVSPILFLIYIVATLCTTALLFFTRRKTRSPVTLTLTPVPPSPSPSHTSFPCTNSAIEKPPPAFLRSTSELDLSPRRPTLQQNTSPRKRNLFLLLSVQLSYMIATALFIPTALRTPPGAPLPLVSLVFASSGHAYPSSTYILRVLDTVFTIIALLLVFPAYYHYSRDLLLRGTATSTLNRTPTIPRRPDTRILSPSTTPTPLRIHSLVVPPSPTSTSASASPISLEFFKPKHKRAGPSASSSFFSPRPKRTPLAPTSNVHLQPGTGKRALDEPNVEPVSLCPSSVPWVTSNPTLSASDTKKRSSVGGALPLPSPASDPVLVRVATPMPILCRERAWSWAHSTHIPNKDRREELKFDDEDCTDLKDPFASGPVRPTLAPSAYTRWAASVEGSSSEARRWSEYEAKPRTRMSALDRRERYQACQGKAAPSLRVDTTVCAAD
ncbi:hypothetical protein C0995_015062 [Termitomyces sp. Mi166|nr:hypothetical protein C0995_015062 [Termitomyces sp. Mi166\